MLPLSLETSLVEWKRREGYEALTGGSALETSLVEWKLGIGEGNQDILFSLGNFLSGMETSFILFVFFSQFTPWKLP